VLHTPSGVSVGAARVDRNSPIHQLAASRLALSFSADETTGRTRMHVNTQEPPWRVIRAFPQSNGSSLVHLHNVSGGILAGDHLSLDLRVGRDCIAQVTSTGATRLYRHRQDSHDSEQHVQIHVEENALLEYLPDTLIPFAGSRHRQRTSIHLADQATLFWWETLAPGRLHMGETFAFEKLHVQTAIRSPRKPLFLDDFVLQPTSRPLASAARLGGYTHMACFYACKVGTPPTVWRDLESQLNVLCVTRSQPGAIIWGATTLVADGIAVRGLSVSACDIPATLHDCWKIARRFLTGTEAVPPRKVY